MTKISEALKSKNFLVSIMSILLLALSSNSIQVGYTAEDLYGLFNGKIGNELIVTIVLFVLNSGSKIYLSIKQYGFNWGFLKSSNFIAALISTFSIVVFATFNQALAGIVIALSTQVINLVYHFSVPSASEPPPR